MTRLYWGSGILLVAAWFYPLHVLPWMSWANEVIATAALLVGCVGAFWVQRHGRSGAILLPSVSALPLLVAVAAFVQWIAGSVSFFGTVVAVTSYALLCTAAAVAGRGAQLSSMEDREAAQPLRALALVLVMAGLVQLLVVFGQTLLLFENSEWVARTAYDETRAGGNVAQPNQAALLFAMAIASTVYLRYTNLLRAPAASIVLGVFGLALATTASRSGLLAAISIIAWQLLRPVSPFSPRRVVPVVVWSSLYVGAFAAWPKLVAAYWQTGAEHVNLTTSGRIAMWDQLLHAVQLRPWFGWGAMGVAEAQNAIAASHPLVMPSLFAHNVLLDFALWFGVPAALLSLLMVSIWCKRRLTTAATTETTFSVALLFPFAVQCMTEFPYAYTYVLVPVFFALGVLDAMSGRSDGVRVPRSVVAVVLALWTGATAWCAVEYVRIEEDFRVVRFEAMKVGSTPSDYEVPPVRLLTQLGALLQSTRLQPRPDMTARELELLRDVAMVYPWGATNFRYTAALALNGRMDEAARQLKVLKATQNPKAYRALLGLLEEMCGRYPILHQLLSP